MRIGRGRGCAQMIDQLLQRVRRRRLLGDHDDRIGVDQADRREIVERVVAQVGIERHGRRMGPRVREHHRMAVGRRCGDARRAGRAAGAGDVLDQHRLAEIPGDRLGDNARHHVGAATRREMGPRS